MLRAWMSILSHGRLLPDDPIQRPQTILCLLFTWKRDGNLFDLFPDGPSEPVEEDVLRNKIHSYRSHGRLSNFNAYEWSVVAQQRTYDSVLHMSIPRHDMVRSQLHPLCSGCR